ncbi:hypothetical protein [Superficieibacter electus]|nr:hypothetical protein [Superficieibacter electus]
MKIYYTNPFILGLSAFLTQTHLSIVRGMDAWDELRDYLSERETLNIIDTLLNASQRKKYEKPPSCLQKVFYTLRKKQYITSQEWTFLCEQLERTRAILLNPTPGRDEVIDVRMKLCDLSLLIERRVAANATIRKIARRVEHFYQADFIVHYEIQQITGIVNGYMKVRDNETLW